jgi:capsular polysaccharide biosynthesis protein
MSAPTFTTALWRRRYLIIGVIVLFLVAGNIASLLVPKSYRATATIFLDTQRNSTSLDLALQSNELLEHDFIVLALKRPVLLEACANSGVCTERELMTPETELRKRVAVAITNGTNLLAVSARSPSPTDAAALANAVAAAMISQDRAELARLFKAAEDTLDAQLKDLQTAIAAEQKALLNARPQDQASHSATLSHLSTQFATVNNRRQDLRVQHEQLANIATVIEPAVPPIKPVDPDPKRYLLTALVLGIAVGVLAALLWQRFDDRLYRPEDLAAATGTSTAILVVPPQGKNGSGGGAYALAHARLRARYPDARKLLVAAASSRDHSNDPALGLGAAAAETGERVLVFQSDGGGEATVEPPALLPNGDGPRLTTVTMTTNEDAKAAALAWAQDCQYDLTIVAVSSPESSPYAISAARATDHAVLIATEGKTRFESARRSAEVLREAGATLAASILVRNGKGGAARR